MTFLSNADLARFIRMLCYNAENRIYISSPYIGGSWKQLLIREDWNALDTKFIVNFSKTTVALGATNPEGVWELQQSGPVRNHEQLHAKLYIFDTRAIVCSANLSHRAFTTNIETGVFIEEEEIVQEIIAFFEYIWDHSTQISTSEIQEMKEIWAQAKHKRRQMAFKDFEHFEPQTRKKIPLKQSRPTTIPKHYKHHERALLFSANPDKRRYDPRWDKVGDIGAHIGHLKKTGGVFWRICQTSKQEEFPYEIRTGYINDTSQGGVTYRVEIEKIGRAIHILEDEILFIPEFRMIHYVDDLLTRGYWWVLIRQFEQLKNKINVQEFELYDQNRPIKGRIRTLAYVKDPD